MRWQDHARTRAHKHTHTHTYTGDLLADGVLQLHVARVASPRSIDRSHGNAQRIVDDAS